MDDRTWREASLSERMLHVLRSQQLLRVEEVPRGSNWGPMVSLYLKAAGLLSPAPWCAALITWALMEAGAARGKLPALSASTYYWWLWAKGSGRLVDGAARRGNLGLWNSASGGHVFAVLNDAGPNDVVRTVEGNTNPGGGREGYAVLDRRRSWKEMQAYPRRGFISLGDDLFED